MHTLKGHDSSQGPGPHVAAFALLWHMLKKVKLNKYFFFFSTEKDSQTDAPQKMLRWGIKRKPEKRKKKVFLMSDTWEFGND